MRLLDELEDPLGRSLLDLGGGPLAGVRMGGGFLPQASLLHILAMGGMWIEVGCRIGQDELVMPLGVHQHEEAMNLGRRGVESVGVATEPAEDLLTYAGVHILQPALKSEMDMRGALASI